jgi:hypothetical protein
MIDKNMNTYVEQAMDTFVRHSLMSDEFLDFVKDNTKPLDSLMAYYRCAIMEVETKFKVLNEQFSLEYDRNPIESIKTRVKSMDGIIKKVRKKELPLTLEAIEENINEFGWCAPSRKISICWQIVFCGRTIFVWLRKRITFKSQKKVDTVVYI